MARHRYAHVVDSVEDGFDEPAEPAVTLTCRDCSQAFSFEAGEQRHFSQYGWPAPVRCPPCRAEAKARREVRA